MLPCLRKSFSDDVHPFNRSFELTDTDTKTDDEAIPIVII